MLRKEVAKRVHPKKFSAQAYLSDMFTAGVIEK
jgi:hypothetical protein